MTALNDVRRRRIANNGAVLSDAMNDLLTGVVAMHRRLGEVDNAPRDRNPRDGSGYFCEAHQRPLAKCHAEVMAGRQTQTCTGIPNRGNNNDPTGEAAINAAGAELAAERRQERHDDWLLRYKDICDEGLRMGYGKAQVDTSKDERLVDATGCPIDCCPNCWLHVYTGGKRKGHHHEKSIERDAPGGKHCGISKTTQRKVCGPCLDYEDAYGHLPPVEVLKVMHSTGRRPEDRVARRIDPQLKTLVAVR